MWFTTNSRANWVANFGFVKGSGPGVPNRVDDRFPDKVSNRSQQGFLRVFPKFHVHKVPNATPKNSRYQFPFKFRRRFPIGSHHRIWQGSWQGSWYGSRQELQSPNGWTFLTSKHPGCWGYSLGLFEKSISLQGIALNCWSNSRAKPPSRASWDNFKAFLFLDLLILLFYLLPVMPRGAWHAPYWILLFLSRVFLTCV